MIIIKLVETKVFSFKDIEEVVSVSKKCIEKRNKNDK